METPSEMNAIREFSQELERKFKSEKLSVKSWVNVDSEFYVIQVPGCDALAVSSRKFKNWKSFVEQYAEGCGMCVLITDDYPLNETFKRIY